MKKYIVVFCCLILATGILGTIGKKHISDCGIASAKTIEDVDKIKCYFTIAETKQQLEQDKKMLEKPKELFSGYDHADNIAIVMPTGKVQLHEIQVTQEVKVLEIKKGNKQLVGKKIILEDLGAGFQLEENRKNPSCYSIQNIMQEDTKYLCFFNDIPLNKKNNIEQYHLAGGQFGFFNLDRTNQTKIFPKQEKLYKFGDLADIEFFCSSKEALEIANKIKEKVVRKYCQ